MKNRKLLAGFAILVAFALVAGPIALARRDGPVGAVGPSARLVSAVESGSRDRDLRPAGASIGDEFLLTQKLSEDGRELGTNDTTCSLVRVVAATKGKAPLAVSVQCTGVAVLGPDVLTYQGLNSFAPGDAAQSRFVVTGGSGAFADATGELRVTETGKGTSTLALDLVNPQGSGGQVAQ